LKEVVMPNGAKPSVLEGGIQSIGSALVKSLLLVSSVRLVEACFDAAGRGLRRIWGGARLAPADAKPPKPEEAKPKSKGKKAPPLEEPVSKTAQ
jgi:hypothetical protein